MTQPKILIFMSSTRDGRNCDRVTKFVQSQLKAQKPNYDVEVLDPKALNLPVLQQALQFYPDKSKAPAILHELNEKIVAAAGIILVTAEYNRQLPPALTNLINHFPPSSYAYKAAAIVSYSLGPGGGVLAAHQCRNYLVEMGCVPASRMLQIGTVTQSIDEAGVCSNDRTKDSMSKLIDQFDWWLQATQNQIKTVGLPK